jgi:hypothetical protein
MTRNFVSFGFLTNIYEFLMDKLEPTRVSGSVPHLFNKGL